MLRRQATGWLRRGQSVVLDATYGQPHERLGSHEGAQKLQPLDEIVATGRTQADRILDVHARANGDPAKMIARRSGSGSWSRRV